MSSRCSARAFLEPAHLGVLAQEHLDHGLGGHHGDAAGLQDLLKRARVVVGVAVREDDGLDQARLDAEPVTSEKTEIRKE